MAELGRQNSHAVTCRLSAVQYHHLIAQATLRELSVSEALRQALERDIDAQPGFGTEEDPSDISLGYRSFLQLADFSAAVEELEPS